MPYAVPSLTRRGAPVQLMKLSVIIPAFNEAAYIGAALDSLEAAAAHLRAHSGAEVEVVVVDNNSTDDTAAIARDKGATVVTEPAQGIARARNAGARHAEGDVLVFVDADVTAPTTLLEAIHAAMDDPSCVGGGVDVEYRPRRLLVSLHLRAWRLLARLLDMVQGPTQFCRASVFGQVGGYDERAWIGEDVDFYWSLKRFAKRTGGTVSFIRDPRVQASSRRFDTWPLWKVIVWTNPLFIALFRRRKGMWGGWYTHPVR